MIFLKNSIQIIMKNKIDNVTKGLMFIFFAMAGLLLMIVIEALFIH